MKLSTGVMVLYADRESFTLMTPEGHMFAGWITFSASERDGSTVAQAQVLMRASDPIYELGLTFGGHRQEDRFWQQTLTRLAAALGQADAPVDVGVVCVDRRRQWSRFGNVWQSAAIRSALYRLSTPMRRSMTLVSELDLPHFDYFDPDLRAGRFHEVMLDLRGPGWLARNELATFVLDREAGEFFLRSRATTFPGLELAELFGVTEGPLAEEMRRNILHVNGEDHRRLRNLVNPAFTPRAADRWRPAMRGFLAELSPRRSTTGACEFVGDGRQALPGADDRDGARRPGRGRAAAARVVQHDPAPVRRPVPDWPSGRGSSGAVEELYAYLDALLAARRSTPGDDLISTLLAAEAEGDRLSDVELVNLVLDVLIGGIDTTQSQLAHAVRLLAEPPGPVGGAARRPVARRPRGGGGAALRADHAVHRAHRARGRRVPRRDVPARGRSSWCRAFTGNRDPRDHAEPGRFDITAAARPRRAADLRRRDPLLPGGQPRPGRAAGGPALPGRRRRRRSSSTASPIFEEVTGIYGLAELPLRIAAA